MIKFKGSSVTNYYQAFRGFDNDMLLGSSSPHNIDQVLLAYFFVRVQDKRKKKRKKKETKGRISILFTFILSSKKKKIKSNCEISNSCYYISCRHIELIKWSLVAAISF